MTLEDFVFVNVVTGRRIAGDRLPSSELPVHCSIYRMGSDILAIVHSHSQYASTISCLHVNLPCILKDMAQLIGTVHCAPYKLGGSQEELGAVAAGNLGDSNAVLLANHDAVCCERDLSEAFLINQAREKSAHAFLWASAQPTGIHPIAAREGESERQHYLHGYGRSQDQMLLRSGMQAI